jgi:RNA recognition motif-containing protein
MMSKIPTGRGNGGNSRNNSNGPSHRNKNLAAHKHDLPKGRSQNSVNVFVKYLPQDINEDRLRDLFEKCGEISSVRVMRVRSLK